MRHYYLGLAADYSTADLWRHTLAIGTERDCANLRTFLANKYRPNTKTAKHPAHVILTKNGRTGLAIAFLAYFQPGDAVIVNGFTCFAVYEALKKAGIKPVWADISPIDLNFTPNTLKKALEQAKKRNLNVRGIIVQNSLGHPVDMAKIEHFATRHDLLIIEDLAHSVGQFYPDGRETGTVGIATVLSFGKDKTIDTTSGGAVILRTTIKSLDASISDAISTNTAPNPNATDSYISDTATTPDIFAPTHQPSLAHRLRARFYPLLALTARGLSYFRLSGVFLRLMLKIHWIERSADNRLDLHCTIAKFEAKLALAKLQNLQNSQSHAQTTQTPPTNRTKPNKTEQNRTKDISREQAPLRNFYLVQNRTRALAELKKHGYFFTGFWYEKPVSPERYYPRVKFPEKDCPVATEVASQIINFPTFYSAKELAPARKIVEKYQISQEDPLNHTENPQETDHE